MLNLFKIKKKLNFLILAKKIYFETKFDNHRFL